MAKDIKTALDIQKKLITCLTKQCCTLLITFAKQFNKKRWKERLPGIRNQCTFYINNIDLELIKSYDYTAVLDRPELTKVRALFDSVIHQQFLSCSHYNLRFLLRFTKSKSTRFISYIVNATEKIYRSSNQSEIRNIILHGREKRMAYNL